jgi:uncharacterized delta-60 repeat protein
MIVKTNVSSRAFFRILLLAAACAAPLVGQNVDPNFSASPAAPPTSDINFQQVIQPDGKILIYNAPPVIVSGETRSGMFRLNTDGSLDTTFTYNNEGGVGINNVLIAPDGKIVLAGSAAPNHAKMVRLNSNGSLDNSFSVFIAAVGSPDFTGNWLTVNGIQPDGKVIATHSSWGNIMGTWYSYSMRRYNLDGSIDSTFASPPLEGGRLVSTTVLMEMLPDGRFYLGVTSRSHLGGSLSISRRLPNGSTDTTYSAYAGSIAPSSFLAITDLALAVDGGVLATGVFAQTAVGFPPRDQLKRFLPDGGGFPGFAAPLVFTGSSVHQLSGGKILYSASGGTVTRPLIRLEGNGSLDNTYVLDPAITSIVNAWQVDPMNRPVFLAETASGRRLVRLLENGSIDPALNIQFVRPPDPSSVSTLAVQDDGKVIVSGPFSFMNGAARVRIARLNADGSLDSTFDPGTGFSPNGAERLVLQPDGKILAAGGFSSYNGTPVPGIVRINPDGSRDTTFAVSIAGGSMREVAVQPDGKVLIGGSFSTVNGTTRVGVARLDGTGAVDASFDASLNSGSTILRILVETSGKITIGGAFTTVAGTARNNLARLESNGALDPTLNAGSANTIRHLLQQANGKYVVTEAFSVNVVRRNNDGSIDSSFTSPIFRRGTDTGDVYSLLLLPDGGMLVGGNFDRLDGIVRPNLTRLRFNGSHDTSFMPNGANWSVTALAWYPGGKIMVGGSFSSVDNQPRQGIARLNSAVLQRPTPFDFDGDGRADISVYRPSTNRWYQALSTGPTIEETFGVQGDILSPADFDGDGKTDEAIFRPSNGHWWYKSSVNGNQVLNPFGGAGDIPRPSDFDGDGKADLVIFRPSNNTWYRYSSLTNQEAAPRVFGQAGDQPLVGDFDGDGRADPAIFRPSNGDWWYSASSANGAFRTVHWGQNGDIPVPADYDGDGKTDYAVYRPSEGGWYIYNSATLSFTTLAFGTAGDRPVAADYDGDGKADVAVFRPSTGIWYLLRSTAGFAGYQFGVSTDTAIPGSMIP